MKITSIQAQVKQAGRYSIFVEGTYAFSLSADALLDAGLTQDQELTDADIEHYKRLSSEDKAYNLTLAYVARRMRSEGELMDYFRRKAYAPELSAEIMAKLRRIGFVDDEAFARRWVENRRNLHASSSKKLRLELRQKKVPDHIVQTVLADDETDERALLRELVEKKRKMSRYQDDQKLMAYLARQGFSYDDIKAALTNAE